jgi:membrane-associated phospholipid phosphatase
LKEKTDPATVPAHLRRKRAIRVVLSLTVLVAAFLILSFFVSESAYFPADVKVTRFLQSLDYPFVTRFMEMVSWPGYMPQSLIISAVFVLLVFLLGFRWESMAALAAAVIEELVNICIKSAVRRPRPPASLVHVFETLRSYSFPSGHVMFYTCFFGFVWFLAYSLLKHSWKRAFLLIFFGVMILSIGISRVYLGEHWASDAIGAYIAGCIALIISIQFYRWGKRRFFLKQPAARSRD